MNDIRNPYNLPPDETNSCFVTGIPVFCAKLSPSFALFTILIRQEQQANVNIDENGITTTTDPSSSSSSSLSNSSLYLDVIVSRKKKKGTQDIVASDHLSLIVDEVRRCQQQHLPVRIHGYQPYEKCTCTTTSSNTNTNDNCQHYVMYCWNVNEIRIPTIPKQKQQQSSDPSSSTTTTTSNSHQNLICQEVNDCNNMPPPPPPKLPLSIKPTKNGGQQQQQNKKKRRPGVKNRNRSVHFAEFLVDIFGHETLIKSPKSSSSSCCGILDVAGGGAGGLSFELSLRRGFQTTTIDPRPIKYNKAQRNAINFRHQSRQLLLDGLDVSHRANVLYQRFDTSIWQPQQILTLFDDEFALSDQGHILLSDCIAVVGLHPDQATDDIIKLAIRYNKPWVVCPCCVFPKTFVHRRLPDGRDVKTYEDLCEYIKNISDNVQEVTLGFEGRNKIYYSLPEGWVKGRDGITRSHP